MRVRGSVDYRRFIIRGKMHGGSASEVWLARAADNSSIPHNAVLKESQWEGIGGNGGPWVLSQALYMARMREELGLNIVPAVYDIFSVPDAVMYLMEYCEGAVTVAERLLGDKRTSPRDVFKAMDEVIGFLANRIYRRRPILTRPAEIGDAHLRRMHHRLGLITDPPEDIYRHLMLGRPIDIGEARYENISGLFKDLLKQERMIINGREYPNLPTLLKILEARQPEIEKACGESHFPQFRHGDLSLRNLIQLPDGSHRLIDLRGTDQLHEATPIDISIEYEMGKLAHSLLSDFLERDLFSLALRRTPQGLEIDAKLKTATAGARSYAVAYGYIDYYLRGQPILWELLGGQVESWVRQIRLAEAAHYVANIINRINEDKTGKMAVIYYVYSVITLAQFLHRNGWLPANSLPSKGLDPIFKIL